MPTKSMSEKLLSIKYMLELQLGKQEHLAGDLFCPAQTGQRALTEGSCLLCQAALCREPNVRAAVDQEPDTPEQTRGRGGGQQAGSGAWVCTGTRSAFCDGVPRAQVGAS